MAAAAPAPMSSVEARRSSGRRALAFDSRKSRPRRASCLPMSIGTAWYSLDLRDEAPTQRERERASVCKRERESLP